jgi:hypothetical protein
VEAEVAEVVEVAEDMVVAEVVEDMDMEDMDMEDMDMEEEGVVGDIMVEVVQRVTV